MDPRFERYRTLTERERFNREVVRPFYEEQEDYDWTHAADHFVGLETLMHRFRQWGVQRLLRQFALPGRVLDVGCGSGLMLRHLPPGSVGIDLNPRNCARAQRYAPHAVVQRGDAEALAFPDASFAVVVSTEVLEHLVFPERAVQEIDRVLQPGGVFLGSVPRASRFWRLRFLSASCPGKEPFHNEMTRKEVAALLGPFPHRSVHLAPWLLQYFFVARKELPSLL